MDDAAPAEQGAGEGPPSRRALRRPRRRRVSVVGLFGEVLITAGVLVLLFLGWQTWWNSAVHASRQTSAAAEQSREWLQQSHTGPTPKATTAPDGTKHYGTPAVMDPVGKAEPFAVIYVPRFGQDWKRVVRQSVDVEAVLNSFTAGIGHYTDTQMPGAIGNFAIAGHDTGWGNSLIDVSKLRIGDAIYIQTKEGWYTYRFRNFEYVQPDAVGVLDPVPQEKDEKSKDRLITITTCNPPYHAQERLIAFGTLDGWRPASAGPPKAIAKVVEAEAKG